MKDGNIIAWDSKLLVQGEDLKGWLGPNGSQSFPFETVIID
jgi:hypothetical protein